MTCSSCSHRSRQHRIGRGARRQGAQHRLAHMRYLGEQFRARLVDVAMDQVLQMAGFALQPAPGSCRIPAPAAHRPRPTPAPGRRSRSARPAPRRPPNSAPRSTGCASGSAPRAPARPAANGRAPRSSPAVPQSSRAGGLPSRNSVDLANSFDQRGCGRIAPCLGVNSVHRRFERLAVEVAHDRHAGRLAPAGAIAPRGPSIARA